MLALSLFFWRSRASRHLGRVTCIFFLTTTLAHAFSLGALKVESALGEPFKASLSFTLNDGESVDATCVRPVEANSDVSALRNMRVEIERRGRDGVIIIRTARPVNEPAVAFGVRVECGLSAVMSREFTALLDPAPLAATPPSVIASPASPGAAAVLADARARRQASAERARDAATPASDNPAPSRRAARAEREREARRNQRRNEVTSQAREQPRMLRPATGLSLPYEPGVTPPPRSRSGQVKLPELPKGRLTLSAPGEDATPPVTLRSSFTLTEPRADFPAAERARLAAEARFRLGTNPVAQAVELGTRLGALEGNMEKIKRESLDIAEKNKALQAKIDQLEAKNRTLGSVIDTGLALVAFLVLTAVAVTLFLRHRRKQEAEMAMARRRAQDMVDRFDRDRSRTVTQPSATTYVSDEYADSVAPIAPASDPVKSYAPEPEAAPAPIASQDTFHPELDAPIRHEEDEPTTQRSVRRMDKKREADRLRLTTSHATLTETPTTVPVPKAPAPAYVDTVVLGRSPLQAKHPTESTVPTVPLDGRRAGFASSAKDSGPPRIPEAHQFDLPVSKADSNAATTPPVLEFTAPTPPPTPDVAIDFSDLSVEFTVGNPTPIKPDVVLDRTVDFNQTISHVKAVSVVKARGHDPLSMTGALQFLGAEAQNNVPSAAEEADARKAKSDAARARAEEFRHEFEAKLFPELLPGGAATLEKPYSIVALARTYYQEDFDTSRAINLLQYAATRAKDPVPMELALFDILRHARMGREYTLVALRAQKHFPTDDRRWRKVLGMGALLAPEEPIFANAETTGLTLEAPSDWLGSTLDMTKYVLATAMRKSLRQDQEASA